MGDDITEGSLKLLVCSLSLSIALWIKPGRETDLGPQGRAEFSPNSGGELWASVRNYILGDPVETGDVSGEESSHLQGRRQFQEGDEVSCFGETIDNGEYSGVTCRGWQTGDEAKEMCNHGRIGVGRGWRSPGGGSEDRQRKAQKGILEGWFLDPAPIPVPHG